MFLLLATVGMRPTELLNLSPEDVTLGAEPMLRLRRLKARRTAGRIDDVPIGARLGRILRAYLKVRGAAGGPLFLSQRGGRLGVRTLQHLFKLYGARSGVDPRTPLYALRHTAARRMLESTNDIRTVQVMLGHESIRTTQIYAHVTMERRRQAAESVLTKL